MLTPRTNLTRRVLAALDASPSRIPVLVGGCGSGRTTLLQQLKDRLGRTGALYLDVERSATTPERFLKAIAATSPFPLSQPAPDRELFHRACGADGPLSLRLKGPSGTVQRDFQQPP